MAWNRKRGVVCGIELVSILGMLAGVWWTWQAVTLILGLLAGWLFPNGIADLRSIMVWGPSFVLVTIVLYGLTLAILVWAMVGILQLTKRWLGWPRPSGHHGGDD